MRSHPLEDLEFYYSDGRMWNEDCDALSDCLSSPQVYHGDELEVGKEYVVAVKAYGADEGWGYTVFTVK